ncbi:MAG TPA: hypothetical protein VN709_04950, partial [Terriglobales bacterium]|nr:hypothetical protein [Terriglobales bacterium]
MLGGFDSDISTGSGKSTFRPLPAEPAEAPFLKQIFGLYGDTSIGTRGNKQFNANPASSFGCNLDPKFVTSSNPLGVDPSFNPQATPSATNPIPSDTGCRVNGILTTSAKTPETLTSFRIDYNLNQNNTVWGKFSNDQGTQTTGISAINPVFNEDSFQPDRQGVLDWTHVFTPTLTNDASAGFLWYGAIFDFNTPAAEHAAIDGLGSVGMPTTGVGSTSFPQGRNVTQYEFIDNMTWTKGSHSYKVGENFRRELVNDHRFAGNFASDTAGNWQQLMYGAASSASQRFPITAVEQFKSFSLDLYAGDTWQINRKLTLTYGVRATHNSNPVDKQPFEGVFADFTTFAHPNLGGNNLATAPNSVFTARSPLWSSVPLAVWQPRLSLAWQPRTSTLIKAGWGMFSNVAATSAAETLATNPPFFPSFTGGIGAGNLGQNGSPAGCGLNGGSSAQCGFLFDPTQPGSAVSAAAAGNAQFQKNFSTGAASCASTGPTTTCVPPASVSSLPNAGLNAPVVYQYNLSVQQQMGRNMSFSVGYVGTRSQHNAFNVGDNGYETVCQGCFAPFSFSSTGSSGSPDPRFLSYTQTRYDGYGRYDALQGSFTDRLSHGLTLNFNYTWSHCLNTQTPYLDYNGGANLRNFYDDCTNDITHVANASYTYVLPVHTTGVLGSIVNGWQVSGSTFAEGGVPLFIGNSGGSSLSS